ncbi:MAG TPA: sodium:proton antiporter [Pseudogracilibacillus sp.]|nr:sodium:proton antiporter [Pseudogracilibacillus sp.]
MSLSILFELMLIVVLGVGSQWLAWKFRFPAIVVMSVAGLLIGPVLGVMNPEESFGDIYSPMISIAVAIILFEGSLSLSAKELRGLGRPVIRIATIGAFIAWILGSLTAHYVAGLSWTVAFVIGGLFVVTGPTVIMPLLRQSKLKPRPAKILKWEGIVVDPIGVLLAVFAFEFITAFTTESGSAISLLFFFAAAILAVLLGWGAARGMSWMFEVGYVPEFLKSPMLFMVVILTFSISDEIVKGSGLLAVTAMGMTMANMGTSTLNDFRHFKENISLIFISAIFIMLAASLQMETILQIFSPNIIGYVVLMMIVVRPLSIFLSTMGTGLSLQEKSLVGWIAPRGIVALTVSSYFASILKDAGYEDAAILTTLTFGLVFFTVLAHGFSLGPLAKKLNLSLEGNPGVLLVGSNEFTTRLAQSFDKLGHPVIVTDPSWGRLQHARQKGVPFYHGELLSEQTEYNLDTIPYDFLIAGTTSDTYNALVSATFMPEYGRANVFQINTSLKTNKKDVVSRVGGRSLCREDITLHDLISKVNNNYVFRHTNITEKFTFKQYREEKEAESVMLFFQKPSGQIQLFASDMRLMPQAGDVVVSLSPPTKELQKIKKKLDERK